ncbi:MAG: pyruvate kinase, partial [Desulfobulbaceae bacterium]|nr:pyruvate kinase [Desulfobulbaceae bacterium]
MRKTKIICTIGPASVDFDVLKQLADKGMNVARLNMSHGSYDWHYDVIRHIRTINKKLEVNIAILLDTKGPEVRTGDLPRDMVLKKGDILTMTIKHRPVLEPNSVEVRHDGFVNEVEIGDIVLVDGGMLSFLVEDKCETDVVCKCLDGGLLTSRRHINIRGKSADLPSITEGDWRDIDFGIENGVDFIALSFVRGPEAIVELKKYINEK